MLAAVTILVLIVLVIVLAVVLILVTAVLILVVILILVIHNSFPPIFILRTCRYHSMPFLSGFILCFEQKTYQ